MALLTFTEEYGPLVSAKGDSARVVTPQAHYQSPWAVWQPETLALLLPRAVTQGEIRSLDLEAAVDLIQAAYEPALYLHQRQHRGYGRERIVATLLRLLSGRAGIPAAAVSPPMDQRLGQT